MTEPVKHTLSKAQRRRLVAVTEARKVVVSNPSIVGGGTVPNVGDLLDVADYIIAGRPEPAIEPGVVILPPGVDPATVTFEKGKGAKIGPYSWVTPDLADRLAQGIRDGE